MGQLVTHIVNADKLFIITKSQNEFDVKSFVSFIGEPQKMDILKKLLNNPAFDHLAENIISFMDTDEAMETMIESELLSDEERKVMRKMLRKLMIKEAQMYCEKEVEVILQFGCVETTLYKMFPFFKDALQELKNSETLESFNQLYDILVWLQPGESQSNDQTQLQKLYHCSHFKNVGLFRDVKGPKDMLEAFELANEADEEYEDEDEDDYDYDGRSSMDGFENEDYCDRSDFEDFSRFASCAERERAQKAFYCESD